MIQHADCVLVCAARELDAGTSSDGQDPLAKGGSTIRVEHAAVGDHSRQRLPRHQSVSKRAGVVGPQIHPQAFRHCFAVTYIRRGGDIYRLSRLGHASITTTQRYLRSMGVDTINEGHQRLSPLLNRSLTTGVTAGTYAG